MLVEGRRVLGEGKLPLREKLLDEELFTEIKDMLEELHLEKEEELHIEALDIKDIKKLASQLKAEKKLASW